MSGSEENGVTSRTDEWAQRDLELLSQHMVTVTGVVLSFDDQQTNFSLFRGVEEVDWVHFSHYYSYISISGQFTSYP